MYSFDYDVSDSNRAAALFHAAVYSIADKYCVSALKHVAKKKFSDAVGTCWDTDGFSLVITDVYSSTPPNDRDLRDLVLQVSSEHIHVLLKKPSFRRILGDDTGFAVDIIQYLADYYVGSRVAVW